MKVRLWNKRRRMSSRHVPAGKFAPELERQLESVEPSLYGALRYYPSLVILKSGTELDCVCIVEETTYLDYWGVYPEDDPHKKWVSVEDIASIRESPSRLPPRFANRLYDAAESGMGYCIFTLIFSDGLKQAYQTGNVVDFLQYPPGHGPLDVVDAQPLQGRGGNYLSASEYYWCLYSVQ